MGKEFDVVVVGGRCAGSPLATLLARAGLSVALVEQATFPRDTLHSRRAAAEDAGVSADGTGSHRIVIAGGSEPFTDPDGFAWQAITRTGAERAPSQ